jgi:hypothetical protein
MEYDHHSETKRSLKTSSCKDTSIIWKHGEKGILATSGISASF